MTAQKACTAAILLSTAAALAQPQCAHPWFPHRRVGVSFDRLAAFDLNGRGMLELIGLEIAEARLELVSFDDDDRPTRQTLFSGDVGAALVAADFDGDGDTDVVVYRPSLGSLQVLLNSDQTLAEGPTVSATNGFICATDFDDDGDQDIALVTLGDIRVFLNAGDATFTAGPSATIAEGPFDIHPARLDPDGLQDFICYMRTGGEPTIIPVRQVSPGQLQAAPAITARLRALGDADGDTLTDLITFPVDLRLGNGDGTFQPGSEIIPDYDEAKLLTDLDHDGDLDLIANSLNDGLRALTNDGTGSFTETPGNVGHEYAWGPVITPDFDGDGNPDLITPRLSNTDVWLGNGDATFDAYPSVPLFEGQVRRLTLGDIDMDGDTDVVAIGEHTRNSSPLALAVLLNDGAGTLSTLAYVLTPASDFTEAPVLADFDADGDLDIALITNEQITLFENTPTDPFTTTHTLPFDFDSEAGLLPYVTDLNSDGLPDLVSPGRESIYGVRTYLNQGGWGFTVGFAPGTNDYDTLLAAADFDGDSHPDVILGDSGRGPLAICFGNGDGTLTQLFPYDQGHYDFSHGYTADFNADGAPDLLLQEVIRDRFSVLLNDGFGGLYFSTEFRDFYQARGIGIGDLNGDGFQDVAMSDALQQDQAGFYLGDGTGALAPHIPFSTGFVALRASRIADMNGDGTNDIVIAGNADQYGRGSVAVALNPCPAPPCPADFNNNGEVNTADFIAFLNAWAQQRNQDCSGGECSADFNHNGVVDTIDFVEFLNAWVQGC